MHPHSKEEEEKHPPAANLDYHLTAHTGWPQTLVKLQQQAEHQHVLLFKQLSYEGKVSVVIKGGNKELKSAGVNALCRI